MTDAEQIHVKNNSSEMNSSLNILGQYPVEFNNPNSGIQGSLLS